ncbi:MAG: DsbE family thiol:disulfide interchange protein [Thiotrichaceae bacterium]|nr:DsbE family thiol:disulfide interchange protein [Thiotrichaceae bacterium]
MKKKRELTKGQVLFRVAPLVLFLGLGFLLFKGLSIDPRYIPSPFIGKPAADFTLPRLYDEQAKVSTADFKGKVWLLNVWASWCISCRAEHELINQLVANYPIDVVGLNYKDHGVEEYRGKAKAWLARYGNPYKVIAVDTKGRVGIDYGVTGVPETFVIDKKGIIRHRFSGAIRKQQLVEILLPLVKKLRLEP